MSISMAMEDRMEAASQVEILKRSQGDHYVPFISAELRQALDLKMKAGAQLSSMIKNIMGGTTNVFNINNQSSAGVMEQNNFVTIIKCFTYIINKNKFRCFSILVIMLCVQEQ